MLVQLHDSLKPFLLALKKEFAKIPLLEILRLRSRYAMTFYQMCCSWYGSNGRSWTLSLEELRECLDPKRMPNISVVQQAAPSPRRAQTAIFRLCLKRLHIEDGELVKVNHLKSRIIDQAKHELDAKARISFRGFVDGAPVGAVDAARVTG